MHIHIQITIPSQPLIMYLRAAKLILIDNRDYLAVDALSRSKLYRPLKRTYTNKIIYYNSIFIDHIHYLIVLHICSQYQMSIKFSKQPKL